LVFGKAMNELMFLIYALFPSYAFAHQLLNIDFVSIISSFFMPRNRKLGSEADHVCQTLMTAKPRKKDAMRSHVIYSLRTSESPVPPTLHHFFVSSYVQSC
jgi:hypothetical protein